MGKHLLSLFASLLIWFAFVVPQGFALSCEYRNPKELVRLQKYVLLVDVISANETAAKFRVTKSYKGKTAEDLEFSNPDPIGVGERTPASFKVGKKYIIITDGYIPRSDSEGRLDLQRCDYVSEDGRAGALLKWLSSPEFKTKK